MVQTLNNEPTNNPIKRLILTPNDIGETFSERTFASFISKNSMQFFSRFGINTDFLKNDPTKWNTYINYLHGKEIVCSLNVVICKCWNEQLNLWNIFMGV
jgi:hypothetical protein